MRTFRPHAAAWLWLAATVAWPAAGAEPAGIRAGPTTAPGTAGDRSAAPPAAAPHPLERLHERIAARLSAVRASPAGGSHDLQIVNRAPPASPRAAAAAARPAIPAPRGRQGADAGVAWGHHGAAGPQAWGSLEPGFALCANGRRQSPIDIQGGLSVDLEPVRFNYQASRFTVVDTGHTVQANVAPGQAIEVGGRRYELQQFHFHHPAEERIDGRAFEMSLHLVHRDEHGRLAVVALLLERGAPQPAVQQVWNNLPLEQQEEVAASTTLDLETLLPADRGYYTYMGSLTTPPCSEGVQWVVMRQPLTVSPEQIDLFARIYPMNARPLQSVGGRRILQSN